MRRKKIVLSNFSRSLQSESSCIRPDSEKQLNLYLSEQQPSNLLTRGSGLSYSDCCLNNDGLVIDIGRFNHFISFDSHTGELVCQAGVTFRDLLYLHSDYIPPVLPGTLHATLGGGLANDIHGKNNHQEKSLGHHVIWLELLAHNSLVRCSKELNSKLFYATLAGIGLTGVITRVALRLKRASHFVAVDNIRFESLEPLLEYMATKGLEFDYQVAWLDLLKVKPRGLLSLANHSPPFPIKTKHAMTLPKLPFALINKWNISWFNHYYFNNKKSKEFLSLEEFNNPLDKLNNWNHLYGKNGLLQFQAVFPQDNASHFIEQLLIIIKNAKATPTLSVLKLLTHSGLGMLSFCSPGFTLAIDFINNEHSQQAIQEMNQLVALNQGKIYLAKDLLLTTDQFRLMYPNHHQFTQIVKEYQSPMNSDMAQRLGLVS